jgi:hypothetical protein
MTTAIEPLILDFLEWVAAEPRPYRDVMDAWRTSCPRLTVWEDSIDAGYVTRMDAGGPKHQGPLIGLTSRGLDFLKTSGRIRRESAR